MAGVERMHIERAEERGKVALLNRRQRLVLKEEDEMLIKRRADVAHVGFGECRAQIDAFGDRTNRGR